MHQKTHIATMMEAVRATAQRHCTIILQLKYHLFFLIKLVESVLHTVGNIAFSHQL